MKSCLEIENQIKSFIEEYNRNYQLASPRRRDHSNEDVAMSPASQISKQFYDQMNQNGLTMARSLSLNSINSHLAQLKGGPRVELDQCGLSVNNVTKVSIQRNIRKWKSESDLLDIINNKSCLYYFDETSMENNDEEDDEDSLLLFEDDGVKRYQKEHIPLKLDPLALNR